MGRSLCPSIVSLQAKLNPESIHADGSTISFHSNSSVYSIQCESSIVESRPSSSTESDCETIMSSYVEAQIDNTIQWIENYTYSPEFIETVTLPVEEHMCTSELTAPLAAPAEHHTYSHDSLDTVTPQGATYRHTFEAIHSAVLPVAEHTLTPAYSHPTTPLTWKRSKLSKKRPARESCESPSLSTPPSTPERRLCLLDLSPLKHHRKSRTTGWVKSPKSTSLGFADFGYSTRYREAPSHG